MTGGAGDTAWEKFLAHRQNILTRENDLRYDQDKHGIVCAEKIDAPTKAMLDYDTALRRL